MIKIPLSRLLGTAAALLWGCGALMAWAPAMAQNNVAEAVQAAPRGAHDAGSTVLGIGYIFERGGETGLVIYAALLLALLSYISTWSERRTSRAIAKDYLDGARLLADAIEDAGKKNGEAITAAVQSMLIQHAAAASVLGQVDARLREDPRNAA